MWFHCAVFRCELCATQYVQVITKLADRSQTEDCPTCGQLTCHPMMITLDSFREAIGLKVMG